MPTPAESASRRPSADGGQPPAVADGAARRPPEARLGAILVRQGAAREVAIAAALRRQRRSGAPLGEILLAHGLATPEALARAVAGQLGLRMADLATDPCDPDLVAAAPWRAIVAWRAIPWRLASPARFAGEASPGDASPGEASSGDASSGEASPGGAIVGGVDPAERDAPPADERAGAEVAPMRRTVRTTPHPGATASGDAPAAGGGSGRGAGAAPPASARAGPGRDAGARSPEVAGDGARPDELRPAADPGAMILASPDPARLLREIEAVRRAFDLPRNRGLEVAACSAAALDAAMLAVPDARRAGRAAARTPRRLSARALAAPAARIGTGAALLAPPLWLLLDPAGALPSLFLAALAMNAVNMSLRVLALSTPPPASSLRPPRWRAAAQTWLLARRARSARAPGPSSAPPAPAARSGARPAMAAVPRAAEAPAARPSPVAPPRARPASAPRSREDVLRARAAAAQGSSPARRGAGLASARAGSGVARAAAPPPARDAATPSPALDAAATPSPALDAAATPPALDAAATPPALDAAATPPAPDAAALQVRSPGPGSTGPGGDPASSPATALPCVTILVALYREPHAAPGLIAALRRIDYPAERLDVILALERDDAETAAAVAAADPPPWLRVIPAPPGAPRTKPRALNHALDFARGAIVGVYDAEDRPDPGQVRRAVEAFAAAPPDVACLQARLRIHNGATNWLTRCFAMEYAVWFHLVLPALVRLGAPTPLAGTSLFMRRRALERLGAWDAWNVTEDADLGVRLARAGWRTEMFDSDTDEEAVSRVRAWVRQRSRWQKGYVQTWLTHMRDPLGLARDLGLRGFLLMQVHFLGAGAAFLSQPLFWTALFAWSWAAERSEALGAPGWPVLALLGFMHAGQGIMVASTLVALRRCGWRGGMAWALTLPAYWPLATLAAFKALFEAVTRPAYWDKTSHGAGRPSPADDAPIRRSGAGRAPMPAPPDAATAMRTRV